MTSPTRSGSRSSAQEVKSDRSPNSTVTTRRSAASSHAGGGERGPAVVAEPRVRHGGRRAGRAKQRSDRAVVCCGGGGGVRHDQPGGAEAFTSDGFSHPCGELGVRRRVRSS